MSPDALPADWQGRMIDMIRGVAPLQGDFFAGGAVLDPVRQIGVYEMMYRVRLYEALVEELRGTAHLLGDQTEETLRAYLRDHPSTTWTLNRVADHFVAWMSRRNATDDLIDMARLDHAVQAVFEATDEPGLRPDQLGAMPPLRLHRAVRLLRLGCNAHDIRSAVLTGGAVPPLTRRPVTLLVFRRDIRVRHWEVPAPAFALLERIEAHGDFALAADEVVTAGVVTPEALAAGVAAWFRDFAERQVLVQRDP